MTGTAAAAEGSEAPGAPGASANWTTGNKQGLGTSVGRDSKVRHTLADGALSEVYYPSGDTANVRSLEFAVTDGTSFVDRESEDTSHAVRLTDPRSLTYEQVNTAKSGRYRITKTYVTDPARRHGADARDVRAARARQHIACSRSMTPRWATPRCTTRPSGAEAARRGLLTSDGPVASALVSSSGSRGRPAASSDERRLDGLGGRLPLDWDYDSAPDGNVLQTGEISLKPADDDQFTLALGFGDSASGAGAPPGPASRARFAGRAAPTRRLARLSEGRCGVRGRSPGGWRRSTTSR